MKKVLPYIIIILVSTIVFVLTLYFKNFETRKDLILFGLIWDIRFLGIIRVISFITYWYGVFKFIFKLKRFGPLCALLIPVFMYLIATCYIYGEYSYQEKYCKMHNDSGYYIFPAIKKDFNFCGWEYQFILNNKRVHTSRTVFIPNSDMILLGVMKKEENLEQNFIFNKHPTNEEIEHAKRGWYMEGDSEKTINILDYGRFVNSLLKKDSILKEKIRQQNEN